MTLMKLMLRAPNPKKVVAAPNPKKVVTAPNPKKVVTSTLTTSTYPGPVGRVTARLARKARKEKVAVARREARRAEVDILSQHLVSSVPLTS
jgi:hypothetical protein